ncbi:hypothetical protein AB9_086 [Acinetobacter phage vB_AbaM_B9]|nr:hypothetical protein AB9_086 [Acinetobacter phage vB_AbaM_B9]
MRDWKDYVESFGYEYCKIEGTTLYYSKDGWDFHCNKYNFPPKKVAIKNCLTPEKYIIHLMNKKHGGKYGYDKFKWSGSVADYSEFYCPEHGYFKQIVNNHLKGYGCFKCNGSEKLTEEDIRVRCQEARGFKYDYSNLKYDHKTNKITLLCRRHGEFSTNLYSHLKGVDCKECYRESSFGSKVTTEDFIKKAEFIHGDKYDYSLVEYECAKSKVKIICSEHGVFEQVANYHLSGNGCQKCGVQCTGYTKTAYTKACASGSSVYVFELSKDYELFYKIGISKNIKNRVAGIVSESGYLVTCVYEMFFKDASVVFDIEKLLHREFSNCKYVPNFRFAGDSECFILGDYNEVIKILNCVA